MTMQRLCQLNICATVVCAALLAPSSALPEPPTNDYPTSARVEYVNDCIAKNGGQLAHLYQCSCVIDALAKRLTYDEFVEASTYSRYSGLAGEAGSVFRDSRKAKDLAKLFRELEGSAHRECGLSEPK